MSWWNGSQPPTTESAVVRIPCWMASWLASRLRCVTMTPLGSLTDPEVYCR